MLGCTAFHGTARIVELEPVPLVKPDRAVIFAQHPEVRFPKPLRPERLRRAGQQAFPNAAALVRPQDVNAADLPEARRRVRVPRRAIPAEADDPPIRLGGKDLPAALLSEHRRALFGAHALQIDRVDQPGVRLHPRPIVHGAERLGVGGQSLAHAYIHSAPPILSA